MISSSTYAYARGYPLHWVSELYHLLMLLCRGANSQQLMMDSVQLVIPLQDYAALFAAARRKDLWQSGAKQTAPLMSGISLFNVTSYDDKQLRLGSYQGWGWYATNLTLIPLVPLPPDYILPDEVRPYPMDPTPPPSPESSKNNAAVGIGIGVGVGAAVLIALAVLAVVRRRRSQQEQDKQNRATSYKPSRAVSTASSHPGQGPTSASANGDGGITPAPNSTQLKMSSGNFSSRPNNGNTDPGKSDINSEVRARACVWVVVTTMYTVFAYYVPMDVLIYSTHRVCYICM